MFNDIPIFVALVEAGSFVQAARNLGMTQATVSRRLQALEQSLGFKLIMRSTRKFEVTQLGKELYRGVKSQQLHLQQLIDSLQHSANGMEGILRVSLPTVMSYYVITPFLAEFLQAHPGVKLEICYQNRELDIFKERFDLAIVNYRPKQQTLKIRKLFSQKFYMYCTKEYIARYGLPSTIEELKQHLTTGTLNSDLSVDKIICCHHINGQEDFHENMARFLNNNALQSKQFAMSGHAIAGGWDIVFTKELATGDIIKVLPEYNFGEINFYLIRLNEYENPLITTFIQFIDECIKRFNEQNQ